MPRPRSPHRLSYADDPSLSARVFPLLERCFPGITAGARHGARLGAPWEESSTPYVQFEGDAAVAHVGVLPIPAVLLGRRHDLLGIHAVCTDPGRRGEGRCRALMEAAIADCGDPAPTLVLFTSEPGLYERYGFRVIPQNDFSIDLDHPGGGSGFRRMTGDDPADRAIVARILESREPVSGVLGIAPGERAVFCFRSEALPLWHCADLECLVSMEHQDGVVLLHDIAAPRLPALPDLVARLPMPVRRVVLRFNPDRIAPGAAPCPPGDPNDFLMVRGAFPPEGIPLSFPSTARC